MKIAINCEHILLTPTGPVFYIQKIIQHIAKIDTKNEYYLFFPESPPPELLTKLDLIASENFRIVVIKKVLSWTHISVSWYLFELKIDVYFSPVHTVPIIKPFRTKYVSMIHGLEYISNKQFFNKPLNRIIHPIVLLHTIIRSKVLIVPSLATKDILFQKGFLRSGKKLRVIYEGVDSTFSNRSEEEIRQVKAKYGITGKYFLFLSTLQPRKNIPNMIAAFAKFSKTSDFETSLIISGKKGWLYDELLLAVEKYSGKNTVKYIGRADDEDRSALYSGALAYVNFSFEEGFGLPLLEAMRCKTVILASAIPAHLEVSADCGIFVDSKSISDMAAGFLKVATQEYPPDLVDKAYQRSLYFDWDNTAKDTVEIFNSFSAPVVKN